MLAWKRSRANCAQAQTLNAQNAVAPRLKRDKRFNTRHLKSLDLTVVPVRPRSRAPVFTGVWRQSSRLHSRCRYASGSNDIRVSARKLLPESTKGKARLRCAAGPFVVCIALKGYAAHACKCSSSRAAIFPHRLHTTALRRSRYATIRFRGYPLVRRSGVQGSSTWEAPMTYAWRRDSHPAVLVGCVPTTASSCWTSHRRRQARRDPKP